MPVKVDGTELDSQATEEFVTSDFVTVTGQDIPYPLRV